MEEEIRFITVDDGMGQVLRAAEIKMAEEKEKRRKLVLTYCNEAIKRAVENAKEKLSIHEMKSEVLEEMYYSDVTVELRKMLNEAGWLIEDGGHGKFKIRPTNEKIQEYEIKLGFLKSRYEQ